MKPDRLFKKRPFFAIWLFHATGDQLPFIMALLGPVCFLFWLTSGFFLVGTMFWALQDRLLLRSYHCPNRRQL